MRACVYVSARVFSFRLSPAAKPAHTVLYSDELGALFTRDPSHHATHANALTSLPATIYIYIHLYSSRKMTALEKYRKTLLNYKKNKLRNLNKYTT